MKPRKEVKETKVAVHRDGELYGVGLTRKEAETLIAETLTAYPETIFTIVPGGVVKPGNREKK
jgi:hypothetical protein